MRILLRSYPLSLCPLSQEGLEEAPMTASRLTPYAPEKPVFTVAVNFGIHRRGRAKKAIMLTAMEYGLDCTVEEHKSLLSSLYIFTFTSYNTPLLMDFHNAIREWVKP